MSKKKHNEFDRECPICGGIIWGKGEKVLIEGAKITVCQNCAQHGIKIQTEPKTTNAKKFSTDRLPVISKKIIKNKDDFLETQLEVVPDYAIKIKKARNDNNLTQEQFALKLHEKESLIRKIEAGKVEPNLELAKKIEKTYNINLLQKPDEQIVNYKEYLKKSTGTSLGDIAFIKKKK